MSRTFPWYPWYPANFLSATRGWSILQRGGYHECLDAQWELNGLPASPEEIRHIVNATSREWSQIWPTIESKFPISEDGKRRNPRLEYERTRGRRVSELRAEIGRIGAQKRWKADGNSNSISHQDSDGNSHQCAKGKTMPSTFTSTITSTEEDQNFEPTSSRRRARSASPMGSRARTDAVIDESDPAVRKRRREAAKLAKHEDTR